MASYSHRQNVGRNSRLRWPAFPNPFRRSGTTRGQNRPATRSGPSRSLLRNLWGLLVMLAALAAFELFNFSTTEYALSTFFGQHDSLGLASWATVLAVACCGIDFAGLARLFTREVGNEPREVWLLTGAWFLGALMNAVMTWWAVASALMENPLLGNELVSREQVLQIVPVFVAGLVWLTRVLLVGAIGIAGDRLLSQLRQKWGQVKTRAGQTYRAAQSSYRAAQSGRTSRRVVDARPAAARPEPLPASGSTRSLLGGASPVREQPAPPRTFPEVTSSRPAVREYPNAYARESTPGPVRAQRSLFDEDEPPRPAYMGSAASGGPASAGTHSGSRASTVSTVTSRPVRPSSPTSSAGQSAHRPQSRPAPHPAPRPDPREAQESFDGSGDDELVYEDLE